MGKGTALTVLEERGEMKERSGRHGGTAPTDYQLSPPSTPHTLLLWLGLSLVFATIYGGLAIAEAFSQDYVIQDDARQHVFWMRRFLDPDLFPNDAIADYFQSVAPPVTRRCIEYSRFWASIRLSSAKFYP
ncbi:hypothetical protein [Lyngbya sp. CCY1209]|uniref:hypothetical protein n=1 Tax=Lyngbya sp. CCY1209 TaxID=2886103 RepID=UPI002D2064BF|nr:hypothetical protein [Lyngbya sp. CCY1209]MEB3885120.1 hypothetical protein [Lyngbya sp. CCY1209]